MGVKIANGQCGIGKGGTLPALIVTGRAWHRPGAFGPHLQMAAFVNPGDAAAAGPNGMNINGGNRDGQRLENLVIFNPNLSLSNE